MVGFHVGLELWTEVARERWIKGTKLILSAGSDFNRQYRRYITNELDALRRIRATHGTLG
ncbi:hypothetical protein BVI2075_150055 [Burkholderia vietnamiensis]|nr:hypothetical protein BVI2075_150055 [Burkholderia vietnamiensis]